MRYVLIAIPLCLAMWAVYKLNQLVVADTNSVPMDAERRRLLIRAERDQDEMLGIGS